MTIRWFTSRYRLFHVPLRRLSQGSWNVGRPTEKRAGCTSRQVNESYYLLQDKTIEQTMNRLHSYLAAEHVFLSSGLDRIRKHTWFYTVAHVQFFLAPNQPLSFISKKYPNKKRGAQFLPKVIRQMCVWRVTTNICFLLAQEGNIKHTATATATKGNVQDAALY